MGVAKKLVKIMVDIYFLRNKLYYYYYYMHRRNAKLIERGLIKLERKNVITTIYKMKFNKNEAVDV